MAVIALLAILWIVYALHASAQVLIASHQGLKVSRVAVGSGVTLFDGKIAGHRLSLGPWPSSEVAVMTEGGDAGPALRRLAILILPWCVLLLLCVGAIGPLDALHHLLSGVSQISATLSPTTEGRRLAIAFFQLLRDDPLRASAVLTIKYMVFNFLPLPGMTGENIVRALLPAKHTKQPLWFRTGGLLMLAFLFSWTTAILSALP